ncbi:MAG: hypothetical protein MTP17_00650 [Candidatus Midichloria sp.]|nr:MAG: hypothetical protein MTP17_00650 [Candidatus Midichloria sp.]
MRKVIQEEIKLTQEPSSIDVNEQSHADNKKHVNALEERRSKSGPSIG